jgi:adenosylhomocysteine nucleosidase
MSGQRPSPTGAVAAHPVHWLVCFAVKEEAEGFSAMAAPHVSCAIEITGMGFRNAANAIQAALEHWRPQSVITAGFAGGLNPALPRGTVVYDPDDELRIEAKLKALEAKPAAFHCAPRIAVTIAEKAALRRQTGADVVEMESAIIRAACRHAGVPCGTIRVISDAAYDELPLDFNTLMTTSDRIDWWKFARTIALKPTVIPRLMEFQRHTRAAARNLGRVLAEVVKQRPLRQGVP